MVCPRIFPCPCPFVSVFRIANGFLLVEPEVAAVPGEPAQARPEAEEHPEPGAFLVLVRSSMS